MIWQDRIKQLKESGQTYNEIALILNTEYPDEQFTYGRVRGWCRRHTQFITPSQLMQTTRTDGSAWELKSYRQTVGNGSVLFKPVHPALTFEQIDEHFKTLDREYKPPVILPVRQDGQYIAEVNISDLHFARLCWHGDTGEDYDFKIARDMFYRLLSDVAHELKDKSIEYIAFPIGNDLINSDTPGKTTVAGTPQDTDLRWQKIIDVATEMLIWGTDLLKKIAPVKAFYVKSNHDATTTYGLVNTLMAWHRNDQRIEIDKSPMARKYFLHGCTLVGYSHGDKEKPINGTKYTPSRLAALMPVEARELWAKAKFCEYHAAHFHTEKATDEVNGVIVRRISSPTSPDTWTFDSGYVGSVRKIQTFLYDREKGLKHIINTTV